MTLEPSQVLFFNGYTTQLKYSGGGGGHSDMSLRRICVSTL